MLGSWVTAGLAEIVKGQIRFWNGSKIFLCHCKDEDDIYQYLGAEMHVLMIDEASTFTERMYQFLRSRVRAVGLDVPVSLEGQFPKILLGSNPGNIGHAWLKKYFIEPQKPKVIWKTAKEDGAKLRQFIPALLEDNPTLMEENPDYQYSLLGLGSPALVEAMRWGNWNINAGAYFPEFGTVHVIAPFEIPEWWVRCRSFDWGSAKPFSVGWWAVSDGSIETIPKGALIRYREWYGAKAENEGLRYTVEQIADGIRVRDGEDKITYSVADTAIFTEDGGASIAERFGDKGVYWMRADKTRLAGWDEFRQRLRGIDGVPMIYFFSTCKDSIRTIPLMISDDHRPEDINTDLEDHAMDEIRYMCMSRPMIRTKPVGEQPIKGIQDMSIDEIFRLNETYEKSVVNYY